MAETPTDAARSRKPLAAALQARRRLGGRGDRLAASLRAEEFRRRSRAAAAGAARLSPRVTTAKVKAFVRELLSTRLDLSGARIRTLALGMFVAYAAIGAKLLALGLSHDPPQTLKGAADEAVSGARPDLLDRNGADPRHRRQDHVGLRRAEPHHRQGRGRRAHHRRASGRRCERAARAVGLEERLHLGQAADHAEGAGRDLSSGIAGRRFPAGEQACLPQRPDRRARDRLRRQGQRRHRRHGEISRRTEPDRSSCRRFHCRSREPEAGQAVARSQGDLRAARRTRRRHGALPRQGGGRHGRRRQHGRSARARIPPRLRSQRSGRRARSDEDQPHLRRRLRNGFDLQGALGRDGAGIGQGQSRLACGRARQLALRPVHHS